MNSPQYHIPAAWRWATLADVCDCTIPMRDPRTTPDKPFVYVDISSVDNRTKRIVTPRILLGREAPSRARQVIRKDDVLVATTRPNLNAVARVTAHLDGEICSTGFCVLRPSALIDPSYLFAFVQTPDFVARLSDLVKGALYPAVTDWQVRSQPIPLPPLPEQRRIAAILDEQMAAVERARAAAEAQVKAAQVLPRAYLRAAFTSPAARMWPIQDLSKVVQFLPARAIASDGDAQVLAVTTAALTEHGFDPSGVKPATMFASHVASARLNPGEILIARSNTPELVGRASLYDGNPPEVVASDLTIRIWPAPYVNAAFLAAYLSFLYVSGYWRDMAGGASGSMKKITRRQIAQLRFPCPPSDQQAHVTSLLSNQLAEACRARHAAEAQLAAINALPAALLRRAFSGEL